MPVDSALLLDMAVDLAVVRAVLDIAVSDIDEPVLDYLTSLIAEGDAGPMRPLVEDVAPFLLASGSAPDEAAAEELCERLEAMLRREFGDAGETGGETVVSQGGKKADKLEHPIRLRDLVAEPEPGFPYGEVHKSRVFAGGEPEESYSAVQTRKKHDGVSLSKRQDKFARPDYGLRPTGGERKPRVKYSWTDGRPYAHDGQLKISLPGGKNAAAMKISGVIVPSVR